MEEIKTLDELQLAIKNIQQYINEDIQTTMATIEFWISRLNSLDFLHDDITEINNQLTLLTDKTEYLYVIVKQLQEASTTREFKSSTDSLSLDRESGAIAFIYD